MDAAPPQSGAMAPMHSTTRNETVLDRLLAERRPRVMGILNVTPDSFSDGGQFIDPDVAIAHGRRMAAEGHCVGTHTLRAVLYDRSFGLVQQTAFLTYTVSVN